MRALLVSMLLAVGIVGSAGGEARGAPMTFVMGTWLRDRPAVYASGDITADTPRHLERFLAENQVKANTLVVFNSGGGNLVAGMEIGEIIRARRLWTAVGSKFPMPALPRRPHNLTITGFHPGFCMSACTLAFLGGVRRDFDFLSVYGVHQASFACEQGSPHCPTWQQALADGQVVTATVVAYVQRMGVDPAYIVEMARASPDQINPLPYDKMSQYRIIHVPREVKWDYLTTAGGDFYLQFTETTEWKVQRVRFFCARGDVPHLVMSVLYDTRSRDGREDARRIVRQAAAGLRLYWTPVTGRTSEIVLAANEIAQPARVAEQGDVTLVLKISPRLLNILSSAKSAQVTTVDKGPDGLIGFSFISFDLDRERFGGFSRSCR